MKKGFTLAEVILGIFLLGIIIISISSVFISGISASKKTAKKVTNINLAEGMLNKIMLMTYTDVEVRSYDGSKPSFDQATDTDNNGIKFPPSPYPSETLSDGGGTVYFYKVTVAYVPQTGNRVKSICVTVTSKGAGAEGDTSVTMEEFKTQ
ncbi:MAG: hypothetical protein ABRQ37_20915 [Candidatus Eremiobacterota bacterium]